MSTMTSSTRSEVQYRLGWCSSKIQVESLESSCGIDGDGWQRTSSLHIQFSPVGPCRDVRLSPWSGTFDNTLYYHQHLSNLCSFCRLMGLRAQAWWPGLHEKVLRSIWIWNQLVTSCFHLARFYQSTKRAFVRLETFRRRGWGLQ